MRGGSPAVWGAAGEEGGVLPLPQVQVENLRWGERRGLGGKVGGPKCNPE